MTLDINNPNYYNIDRTVILIENINKSLECDYNEDIDMTREQNQILSIINGDFRRNKTVVVVTSPETVINENKHFIDKFNATIELNFIELDHCMLLLKKYYNSDRYEQLYNLLKDEGMTIRRLNKLLADNYNDGVTLDDLMINLVSDKEYLC